MEIYVPITEQQQTFFRLSKRPVSSDGLTIGLLDNTKKNADRLLDKIAGLLQQQLGNVRFYRYRKPNSSTPYPQIEKIAEECDLVFNAHGD